MLLPCALIGILFNTIFQSLVAVSTKCCSADHYVEHTPLLMTEKFCIPSRRGKFVTDIVETEIKRDLCEDAQSNYDTRWDTNLTILFAYEC